jgi:hypothetical protein
MLMVIVTWSMLYGRSRRPGRQRQAVGGQAQLDVGRLLLEHAHGVEGLLRVGQRIAGAGDAEHRHLRNLAGHGQHLLDGLLGRELLRLTPGRDRSAVVLAVAVVALDVAGGRHGHVHARVVVVRLFRVARVVLDLLPDLGRHVVGAARRAAARLAVAALRAATAARCRDVRWHTERFDLADADIGRRGGMPTFCALCMDFSWNSTGTTCDVKSQNRATPRRTQRRA